MPKIVDFPMFALMTVTRSRMLRDKMRLARRMMQQGRDEPAHKQMREAHTLAVRLTSDIQTLIDWHNKERK